VLAPRHRPPPPGGAVHARQDRPATRRNIRALVLQLARENPVWATAGSTEELAGLGVRVPATVQEILKKARIEPAPRRTGPAWPQFLRSEADAILACDFLTAAARRHPGLRPDRDRARDPAHPHPRIHAASNRGADCPAGTHHAYRPRRAGAPGQVHDPRPRPGLHRRIRRRPRRRRHPDRALHRPDAPHERDRRTLDRGIPPRTPGPHPHLEPGQSCGGSCAITRPTTISTALTAPCTQPRR